MKTDKSINVLEIDRNDASNARSVLESTFLVEVSCVLGLV